MNPDPDLENKCPLFLVLHKVPWFASSLNRNNHTPRLEDVGVVEERRISFIPAPTYSASQQIQ
jgi:hypothetical protein